MPLLSYSVSLFVAAASICTVPCPVVLPSAWIVLGIFVFFVGHVPRRGCSFVRFLLPTCVGCRVVLVHLFSFFFVVFLFHHLFGVREAAPHGGGTCTPSTLVCTGVGVLSLRRSIVSIIPTTPHVGVHPGPSPLFRTDTDHNGSNGPDGKGRTQGRGPSLPHVHPTKRKPRCPRGRDPVGKDPLRHAEEFVFLLGSGPGTIDRAMSLPPSNPSVDRAGREIHHVQRHHGKMRGTTCWTGARHGSQRPCVRKTCWRPRRKQGVKRNATGDPGGAPLEPMTLEDARNVLGLGQTATFEQAVGAKNKMLEQAGDDYETRMKVRLESSPRSHPRVSKKTHETKQTTDQTRNTTERVTSTKIDAHAHSRRRTHVHVPMVATVVNPNTDDAPALRWKPRTTCCSWTASTEDKPEKSIQAYGLQTCKNLHPPESWAKCPIGCRKWPRPPSMCPQVETWQ